MEWTQALRVARGYAPFAGATVLAWVAVAESAPVAAGPYELSVVLVLLTWALIGASVLRGTDWLGGVASALLFLAAVGVLRQSAGGSTSGTGTLALIPVFYTALYSPGRRSLFVVLGGVAVFYLAPILLIGPPSYPTSQYRAALLFLTVGSIIGLATQQLVAGVSFQANEARARGKMLEQVSKAVHALFDSPQVRVDVCQAARTISRASVALFYEPTAEAGVLRCTAMAGVNVPEGVVFEAGQRSAVARSSSTGEPILISDQVEAQVGSIDLWIAAGRPRSVLFEPLHRQGETVGVLVVGWSEEIRPRSPGVMVAALLAHEAAAVIRRFDAMTTLNAEAQTDPLTGLPNRRAWDVHLRHALDAPGQLAVAILDFDHFKDFNDTHGHPAGDRLLKETAAAWRDQVRAGDVLVRLGGEEFGLLLFDCDAATAREVIQRLCEQVPGEQTCSVGVAMRGPDESAEALVDRADRALYEAKAEGRDRVRLSTHQSHRLARPILPTALAQALPVVVTPPD
jgi:diguanylate cyclase (GGDEF)-like protein